ncbi:MAG TPA: hypothetical protein V6C81_24005 [Planktothrix sp.]|jgi:hypothetical protein
MQEERNNSHSSITRMFSAHEDDLVDELLSLIRREKWENLELHYELSTLSAERTDMVTKDYDGNQEEVPLTLALSATWVASEDEVELTIEIDEPECDWTETVCAETGAKFMRELSSKLLIITDKDNGHGARN